jgi:hypothetical protein
MSGPSFFTGLNRSSQRYGVFTLIGVVTVLPVTAGVNGRDPERELSTVMARRAVVRASTEITSQ